MKRFQKSGQTVAWAWLGMAILLVGCAGDPSARRTRRVMSEEDELELGRQVAEQVEQLMGFSGSKELNAYVDRIGQRLVVHSSRSHIPHEFHVVDMKEPNAFALPGGYIYISRGLLALMNSEDELAAVIGHEIGHVAGRHSAKQQTKSRGWIPLQILAGIGGAAASTVSPGIGEVIASAGQLPASLALASYSRKQENEADRLGQQYAAAEGWDPAAISDTMDALSREQALAGGNPGQRSFFDTHPTTPDRAREGRAYAATLDVAAPNRIAVDRDAFVGRLDGLVVGDSAKGGVFVGDRFIHPDLELAITFAKGWVHENTPAAVFAQPEDQSALFALQMAGEGSDPATVADEIENQVALLERSEPTTINGFPAITAVTRVSQQGREIYVYLAWIAKDEIVYQLLGAAPTSRWSDHRPTFERMAASFRAPTGAELGEVYENRLRLVTARRGETLEQLRRRSASAWSVERLAAANALDPADPLDEGMLIKISRREKYAPSKSP